MKARTGVVMAETRTRLTIGSMSMPVLEDIWSWAGESTRPLGETSFMKGKPLLSARLAARAVLPEPGGPSRRIEMSEVRSELCSCEMIALAS